MIDKKTGIHIGAIKDNKLYAGQYYELYMTGETLEVVPTQDAKEHLVFTYSQKEEMIQELEQIISDLKGQGLVKRPEPVEKEYEVEVGRTVRKVMTFKVKAYTPDEACELAHHQAYDSDYTTAKDDGDAEYETMYCEPVYRCPECRSTLLVSTAPGSDTYECKDCNTLTTMEKLNG
jgi:hypothetical protein